MRPNAVPAVPVVQATAAEFAYIVVQLPKDATLILGGNTTSVTGNVRKFKIPLSNSERSYPYTVRAEMTRGGQLYVAQSTETLVAGETVNVKVNDVAAQPAVDVAAR
ncbi:MAG: TIGR03000 domain-containing protein [Fuerstiella sp.]|nr:TIGR03000 domain-containing protein [Fuerstiella sp.]